MSSEHIIALPGDPHEGPEKLAHEQKKAAEKKAADAEKESK